MDWAVIILWVLVFAVWSVRGWQTCRRTIRWALFGAALFWADAYRVGSAEWRWWPVVVFDVMVGCGLVGYGLLVWMCQQWVPYRGGPPCSDRGSDA